MPWWDRSYNSDSTYHFNKDLVKTEDESLDLYDMALLDDQGYLLKRPAPLFDPWEAPVEDMEPPRPIVDGDFTYFAAKAGLPYDTRPRIPGQKAPWEIRKAEREMSELLDAVAKSRIAVEKEITALKEELNKQIDTLKVRVTKCENTPEKIDEIQQECERIKLLVKEALTSISDDVNEHKKDIEELRATTEKFSRTRQISDLRDAFNYIKNDIEDLKNQIFGEEKWDFDPKEYGTINERLCYVERICDTSLYDLRMKFDAVKDEVDVKLPVIETSIDEIKEKITNLDTAVSNATDKIATANFEISNCRHNVDKVKQRLDQTIEEQKRIDERLSKIEDYLNKTIDNEQPKSYSTYIALAIFLFIAISFVAGNAIK